MPWSIVENYTILVSFGTWLCFHELTQRLYNILIVKPRWLGYNEFSRFGNNETTV